MFWSLYFSPAPDVTMSPNGSSGHSDCHGPAAAWHLDTNMIPHSGLDSLPRHGFQWYQVSVVYVLAVFYTHRGSPCLMKNWEGFFFVVILWYFHSANSFFCCINFQFIWFLFIYSIIPGILESYSESCCLQQSIKMFLLGFPLPVSTFHVQIWPLTQFKHVVVQEGLGFSFSPRFIWIVQLSNTA